MPNVETDLSECFMCVGDAASKGDAVEICCDCTLPLIGCSGSIVLT